MHGFLRSGDKICCKIQLCHDSHIEVKTEHVVQQGWIISSTCRPNIYNLIQLTMIIIGPSSKHQRYFCFSDIILERLEKTLIAMRHH